MEINCAIMTQDEYEKLLNEYTDKASQAYLEAIASIRNNVSYSEAKKELENDNVDGLISLFNFNLKAFADYITLFTVLNFKAIKTVSKRFKFTDDAAYKQHIIDNVSQYLVDKSKANIKTFISQAKKDGLSNDEIIKAVTQKGGIIGLNSSQVKAYLNARKELSTIDTYSHYLKRELRDKRLDPYVVLAIQKGEQLSLNIIKKLTTAYALNMINYRAKSIAAHEALKAVNAGENEGWRQVIAKSNYSPSMVTKTWLSMGDSRVRHTHQLLHSERVQGLDTPFQTASGARMLYPADTSLGAPLAETQGCRCRLVRSLNHE